MKKKFLISACALAACLGACTNEDILTEQTVNSSAENSTVVGADLVSNGMDIVLSGDAETRAVNGAWEDKDEFGLAWYNYTLKGNNGSDLTGIFGPQDKTLWATGGVYNWTGLVADNNIYANHLFSYNADNQVFKTMGDIYQGAYFLYYPYATQSSGQGVLPKTISVNGEAQTGNFATERFNKAFHVSAQDFISAEDLSSDRTLTKQFVLSPAVNVFAIKATAGEEIKGESENVDFFKGLSVMEMTINAGDNKKVFANKATLRPLYIPHVVRNAAGTIDTDKTIEALDAAANMAMAKEGGVDSGQRSYLDIEDGDKTSVLTTTLNNAYTIANVGEEGNEIRAFAFPIEANQTYNDNEAPEVTITVGVNGKYALGTFTIAGEKNTKFNENLKKAFTNDILNKIVRNNAGDWSYVNLNGILSLSEFTPLTNNIKSEEQWNDLVKVYDALADMGVKFTTAPVFTLGADVVFKGTNGTIATPKNLDIELVAYPHGMTIANNEQEISWPKNLLTSTSSVITVAEGTTLNVGMEADKPLINIYSEVRNNGIINVGPKAALGQGDGNKVQNNNRIVVKYGAYVYPATGVEGIIAYRMEDDNEVAKINKLMLPTAVAENKGIASINTLIIPQGITLNLDAKITELGDEGDRYEEDDQTINEPLKDLVNITIELEGGTIENTVYGESGEHNTVKAIIAKDGATSKMIDVQTSNITIEKGTLTIDAVTYPLIGKHALNNVKTILNQAGTKLNVATTVHANTVQNYGTIDVEDLYTLYYGTLSQVNAEGERGSSVGNVKPEPVDPTPSYDELTQAVIDSFNSVGFAAANITTYKGVIDNIKQYGKDPGQAAFLVALNNWRTSKSLTSVDKDTISKNDLKSFEAISGYSFGLTD